MRYITITPTSSKNIYIIDYIPYCVAVLMSKTVGVSKESFKFFEISKLIRDREKYYHIHIPLALANILGITPSDHAWVFVNAEAREVLLKIQAKPQKKR